MGINIVVVSCCRLFCSYQFVVHLRSVSRKRVAATRSETSVVKEKLLSPVPEGKQEGLERNSLTFLSPGEKSVESLSSTPAMKKKRKLYSQTSQHSEVFTPPTDLDQDTPGSVVKKQLRARRNKKN